MSVVVMGLSLALALFSDRKNQNSGIPLQANYGGLPLLVPAAGAALSAAESGALGVAATFAFARIATSVGSSISSSYDPEPDWSRDSRDWWERLSKLSGIARHRHGINISARCAWMLSPLAMQKRMAQLIYERALKLGGSPATLKSQISKLIGLASEGFLQQIPIPPRGVAGPLGLGPMAWTLFINMARASWLMVKAAQNGPLAGFALEAAHELINQMGECYQGTTLVEVDAPDKVTISMKIRALFEGLRATLGSIFQKVGSSGRSVAAWGLGVFTTLVVSELNHFFHERGWDKTWVGAAVRMVARIQLDAADLTDSETERRLAAD